MSRLNRLTALSARRRPWIQQRRYQHELSPLPYDISHGLGNFLPKEALKVVAVDFQNGLLDRLNAELRSHPQFERKSVAQTVIELSDNQSMTLAFNYASLALNNDYFLQHLRPPPPKGELHTHEEKMSFNLRVAITEEYGTISELKSAFGGMGLGLSTPGYLWFVTDAHGHLGILPTFGPGTLLVKSRSYLPRTTKVEDLIWGQVGDSKANGSTLAPSIVNPEHEQDERISLRQLNEDAQRRLEVLRRLRLAVAESPFVKDFLEFSRLQERSMEGAENMQAYRREVYCYLAAKCVLEVRGGIENLAELDSLSDGQIQGLVRGGLETVREMAEEMVKDPSRDSLEYMGGLVEGEESIEELLASAVHVSNSGSSTPPVHPTSTSSPPPGVASSSPASGVSSSPSQDLPPTPPGSRSLHSSLLLPQNSVLGGAPSIPSPDSIYAPGTRGVNMKNMQAPQPKSRMLNIGDTYYPLFCVSLFEHAWLSAGYGVWGKERWLSHFWTVLDWEKVSQNYERHVKQRALAGRKK